MTSPCRDGIGDDRVAGATVRGRSVLPLATEQSRYSGALRRGLFPLSLFMGSSEEDWD